MIVGYARTSTTEQIAGLEAQERDLIAAGAERVYKEQTGSMGPRAALEGVLDFVRDGDTLVVTKIDRLARSTLNLWEIVQALDTKGVGLKVLNLGGETVDTKSATGRLILTIFAGFAQFEREMMLERQREGIAKAKGEGKYKGRKPTAQAKATEVLALASQGMKRDDIARQLGIGVASVYRVLKADRVA